MTSKSLFTSSRPALRIAVKLAVFGRGFRLFSLASSSAPALYETHRFTAFDQSIAVQLPVCSFLSSFKFIH